MRAEQRGSISSVLKNDPVFLIKKRPNFQKLLYHPLNLFRRSPPGHFSMRPRCGIP
uniref:Uncharacterized protein n=1 Tax=Anguilla anguilla TaxID=7936 RepID=A0A0E9UJZ7_ANGAN